MGWMRAGKNEAVGFNTKFIFISTYIFNQKSWKVGNRYIAN